MPEDHVSLISEELHLPTDKVRSVVTLLEDNATIPFIARYRKEATGCLDETVIAAVRDRLEQLRTLADRKQSILRSLEKQGVLTDELGKKVQDAASAALLEDIYLPYRPKRRTRATIAREKGLEPFALEIFKQAPKDATRMAAAFVDGDKGVETAADALSGARDIIAEMINENEQVRMQLRRLFETRATLRSRVAAGKESEGKKYRDYFDWEEPAATAPSHRILAVRRGENEDVLNLDIQPPEEAAMEIIESLIVTGDGDCAEQVQAACRSAYRRLISRSLETEMRLQTKSRADSVAIEVFAGNLRELLMAPPLGDSTVMGIDPGIRTGCKIVCLDRQGKLLFHETLFPLGSDAQSQIAAERIRALCNRFDIEAIAVGNGTGGRETVRFLRKLHFPGSLRIVLVNESGASIYSASDTARREFPDLDLTYRGAVSIGRRLMDPLSELVKIDPKSIGVGQYQHDVDQSELRRALDDVVASCVNQVGVDVNRASRELLSYVSGLGPQLASNIVRHRDANGAFHLRTDLMQVDRMGAKTFEQCAGFLRIRGGGNPLDASAVHPERYPLVEKMATDLESSISDLLRDPEIRKSIDIRRYANETVGLPTLQDILAELEKPGRDPRREFEDFHYAEGVHTMEDLEPGMTLPGIVTNVTAFGAFVDVGVHQDGLVHISEMADRFVKDPGDVVRVHQKVQVRVLHVDTDRKRISLSMKPAGVGRGTPPKLKKRSVPKKDTTKKPFHNPFADALKNVR